MTNNIDKARKARFGFEGYCRLLFSVGRGPATASEIARRMRITTRTAYWILCSMRRSGLVHRREYVQEKPRSAPVPVWAWGPGGDVDNPKYRLNNETASQSVITISAIRDALESGPMTMEKLAEEVGFSREHMRKTIRVMRDAGIVRIGDWLVTDTNHVRMYSFGFGGDAPRKRAIGRTAERQRFYWETFKLKRRHIELLAAMAGPIREFSL